MDRRSFIGALFASPLIRPVRALLPAAPEPVDQFEEAEWPPSPWADADEMGVGDTISVRFVRSYDVAYGRYFSRLDAIMGTQVAALKRQFVLGDFLEKKYDGTEELVGNRIDIIYGDDDE